MTDNPYSSPKISDPLPDGEELHTDSETSTIGTMARTIFLAWERLRIVFVGVLGLLTLLLAGPNLTQLRTLILIAEGAIVANICYFAGPILETYIRWLGYRGNWIRYFLFLSGTLLTAILAVATMASILTRNLD